MTLFQSFIMSFAQGITEFLPVSSSGHLAIIPFLLQFPEEVPLSFDIMLHVATLFAVIIFLRKDIQAIVKGLWIIDKPTWGLLTKIIIAVIPAGIVGIFFKDPISHMFQNPSLVGWAYFGTAGLLFLTFFLKDGTKDMLSITWIDCLLIGIFQAFALVPGFSRSGFTLVGALLVGMKKDQAFRFSFLISIPAIVGAFILEASEMESLDSFFTIPVLLSFVVALLVGLGALWILRWFLQTKNLHWFGFYCTALGILLLILY
ncbi:MAG: undecaprenyl-diphosphate phosphatase [Caldisericia bacterium]|nr:undecaprenyl-diphosphate phosphatase [Caldisericia bacterium]